MVAKHTTCQSPTCSRDDGGCASKTCSGHRRYAGAGTPDAPAHLRQCCILGVVGEPLGFWANSDDRPRGRLLAFEGKEARYSST